MTIEEKFAHMWRRSRADSGMSQDQVASALGVTKKTVQHWESGYSCPDQLDGFKWFKALGLQPMPYYLQLIFEEFDGIAPHSSDDAIELALIAFVKSCTSEQKRKLLYWCYGDHGASPFALIAVLIASDKSRSFGSILHLL